MWRSEPASDERNDQHLGENGEGEEALTANARGGDFDNHIVGMLQLGPLNLLDGHLEWAIVVQRLHLVAHVC